MRSFKVTLLILAAAFVAGTVFVFAVSRDPQPAVSRDPQPAVSRDPQPRVSHYSDAPPFQPSTPILPGQCGQFRGRGVWHQFQCPDVPELGEWRP